MSKGLEALNKLRELLSHELDCNNWALELETIEKELKALEIISKKGIHCGYLKNTEDLEEYNSHVPWREELNQEEYDLLKEVLL